MMAKLDDRDEDRPISLKTAVLSALLPFMVILALCMLAGAAAGLLGGDEPNWRGMAIVAALALLIGGTGVWGLMRLKPWAVWNQPVAPATRKANNLIAWSILAGILAIGPLMILAIRNKDPFALFSNGPVPLVAALVAIVGWVLAVALSLQWHRSVDEHEARTYEFGGLAGLYVYSVIAPAWWLGWRGGLLPAPDTMVIFAGVMAVWAIGWVWRRYR
jgi:hypothetical protein